MTVLTLVTNLATKRKDEGDDVDDADDDDDVQPRLPRSCCHHPICPRHCRSSLHQKNHLHHHHRCHHRCHHNQHHCYNHDPKNQICQLRRHQQTLSGSEVLWVICPLWDIWDTRLLYELGSFALLQKRKYIFFPADASEMTITFPHIHYLIDQQAG